MSVDRNALLQMIRSEVADALKPLRERATTYGAGVYGQSQPQGTEPGSSIARAIRALAVGKGDPERARRWLQDKFPDDPLTRALATTPDSAGGFIIPPGYVAELIELLRPASVVRSLNPVVLPMPNGKLTMPAVASGASAQYIGEGENIPATQPSFRQVELSWKKLAALVPVSNDLIRYSNPQADIVVRDDLVAAMAMTQDAAFIRADGSNGQPKGLKFQAAHQLTASGEDDLAAVTYDLNRMVYALQVSNVRFLRPGWIFSPRTNIYLRSIRDGNGNYAFRTEMESGLLLGYPFRVTSQIPENLGANGNETEIYLADFVDVVIGDSMQLTLDVSDTAAYHNGSTIVAAFSLDQTVIRAIAEHDLGVRHPESVAVMSGVTWGANVLNGNGEGTGA